VETEAALRDGAVTFDQAKPLSKFLTAEDDKEVVDRYACRSVWSLSSEAARHEPPPEPADAEAPRDLRSLHFRHDRRSGMFKMTCVAFGDMRCSVSASSKPALPADDIAVRRGRYGD